MSNALSLIISLSKEGKSPREIAQQLHDQGVKDERGRTISPEMVSGFLRFVGKPTDAATNYMPELFGGISSEAAWGAKRQPSVNRFELDGEFEVVAAKKRRKNRTGRLLSDDLKAEVTKLFHAGSKPDEIAKELGVHLRKIYGFCMMLAGFSVPPGEIEIVIDGNGQRVMKCPPGYAMGAEPPRNVKPTQGGF